MQERTVRPEQLTIQFFLFRSFPGFNRCSTAAETARQGLILWLRHRRDGCTVAKETENCSQHAAVGGPTRAEAPGEIGNLLYEMEYLL